MSSFAYCPKCKTGIQMNTPFVDEVVHGRMVCRGCGNTIATPVSLADLLTDALDRLATVENELKTLKEDLDDEL